MKGFLIDSNIFINANRHYRRAYFPIVWHFFEQTPEVYMLDRVYDEVIGLGDDLSDWARGFYRDKQIEADQYIQNYAEVAQYLTNSNNWTAAGYGQWTDDYTKADPWLIACAKQEDYAIVTDERNTGPNGKATPNEPKIPFVAKALGVRTVDFWKFLDLEHFKV